MDQLAWHQMKQQQAMLSVSQSHSVDLPLGQGSRPCVDVYAGP